MWSCCRALNDMPLAKLTSTFENLILQIYGMSIILLKTNAKRYAYAFGRCLLQLMCNSNILAEFFSTHLTPSRDQ